MAVTPMAVMTPSNTRSTVSNFGYPTPSGLLLSGDRTDHMSVRYLMDRYNPDHV
jgi:hypothetical protein